MEFASEVSDFTSKISNFTCKPPQKRLQHGGKMGTSLGLIELPNCTDAIQALDVMLKTADVKFLTWEKKLGGRLVTIIVKGSVSSVTEAVEAAKKNALGKIVASAVIASPHQETMSLVAVSAKKYALEQ